MQSQHFTLLFIFFSVLLSKSSLSKLRRLVAPPQNFSALCKHFIGHNHVAKVLEINLNYVHVDMTCVSHLFAHYTSHK